MFEKESKIVTDLVVRISKLTLELQTQLRTQDIVIKEDSSPVTAADYIAQTIINKELAAHFPDDPIMGEEDGTYIERLIGKLGFEPLAPFSTYPGGNKGRFWTIDPIDGTKGYIEQEQYAVAIALIENGEVVFGVMGVPRSNVVFTAIRGQGAWTCSLDDGRLKPLITKKEAILRYYEPYHSTSHSYEKGLAMASSYGLEVSKEPIHSQYKYALVALHAPSLYLRVPKLSSYRMQIWDHAAGMLIVEEAGGHVRDLRGKKLNFGVGSSLLENWGIVASNGLTLER